MQQRVTVTTTRPSGLRHKEAEFQHPHKKEAAAIAAL